MRYLLSFSSPWLLLASIIGVLIAAYWRYNYYKYPRYRYTLVSVFVQAGMGNGGLWRRTLLYILRVVSVALLVVLVAHPQLIDTSSKVYQEGIDIVLALDVSDSMQLFDDEALEHSRISVARDEAERFIEQREHDAFSIVVFGNDVISRAPLTLDKQFLKTIIRDIKIGMIDPQGTKLAQALIVAVNRLKDSMAKSKIIILLTDGTPTEDDSDPQIALTLAQKLSIKIYTVGIGGEHGGLLLHPLLGQPVACGIPLNKPLLKKIAQATGGQFFESKRPEDMRRIMATIDQLEKSSLQSPQFLTTYELGMPLLWLSFLLVLSELILSTYIWVML